MLILGDEEATNDTVSIRARNGDQRAGLALADFISELKAEVEAKIATPSIVPPQE